MEKPKYKKGQKVVIYNYTLSGKQVVEGTANLVQDLDCGQWLVRFPGETTCVERNIEIEPVA